LADSKLRPHERFDSLRAVQAQGQDLTSFLEIDLKVENGQHFDSAETRADNSDSETSWWL
jgi:hypothetical protein